MHQIRQKKPKPSKRNATSSSIASTSGARPTIALRDLVDRDRRTSGVIWALSSLSLSLFFRKLFEVKMRGENDFRVKGENIGQSEVIFRKMIFFVTTKHAEKGENDFLKSFSPKTNAPLLLPIYHINYCEKFCQDFCVYRFFKEKKIYRVN